jgi:hypothetical protein
MDYVLTLQGRPTRVKLRLLRSITADRMFLLIDWNV